jgi:hypothetical protein
MGALHPAEHRIAMTITYRGVCYVVRTERELWDLLALLAPVAA